MTVTTYRDTRRDPQSDTGQAAGAWRGFAGEDWRERIAVRAFIQANYTPYEGGPGFLSGPTDRTRFCDHGLTTH